MVLSPISTPSLASAMPTVGRQHERTLIMHQYEAAKHGHAQVVLLTGEPGIGKTYILDDIARLATEDGATVLRGGSSLAEGMPPYLPFLEALSLYIQDCLAEQLETQSATTLQALAQLFPELAVQLENLPINYPLPPEQARFRLYEAVGTFLQSIGATHTLVLILDDLQWADSASLDLLSHIMRRQRTAHLLVLGSYRDCEVKQSSALTRVITELTRQRVLTTIPVAPLFWSEIEDLAEHRLRGLLSSNASALLYTYSGGNPFFAEELLQSWTERKCLIRRQEHWTTVTSLDQTLPSSIINALYQRFALLSPDCVGHLQIAAIIGRSFDLSLLAIVKESTSEKIEECLSEAARSHLVRIEQGKTLIFSNDCIRTYLYTDVSLSRRQILHAKIGAVLETRIGQGKPLNTYQLAQRVFHFAYSDDPMRDSVYSEQAGTQALEDATKAEAVEHYRAALDLLNPNSERRSAFLLKSRQEPLPTAQSKEAEVVTPDENPRLQLALMLIEQAEKEMKRGNTACADDLQKQALTLFETLGMTAYAQQVCGKLYSLAQQPEGELEAVPLPSGLTQRHVTIIKLVAQGKSNRQIGEELGITVKTVSNHLSHIFNRTSCENRAAVTAFAFHHSLV